MITTRELAQSVLSNFRENAPDLATIFQNKSDEEVLQIVENLLDLDVFAYTILEWRANRRVRKKEEKVAANLKQIASILEYVGGNIDNYVRFINVHYRDSTYTLDQRYRDIFEEALKISSGANRT